MPTHAYTRLTTPEEGEKINRVLDDVRNTLHKNIFNERTNPETMALAIKALSNSLAGTMAMNVHGQLPDPYHPQHKDEAFDHVEESLDHLIKELRETAHAYLNKMLEKDAEDTEKYRRGMG